MLSLGPYTAYVVGVDTPKTGVCPKGQLLEGEWPELRHAGMSMIALRDGGGGTQEEKKEVD